MSLNRSVAVEGVSHYGTYIIKEDGSFGAITGVALQGPEDYPTLTEIISVLNTAEGIYRCIFL
jgi:hypothetical protein